MLLPLSTKCSSMAKVVEIKDHRILDTIILTVKYAITLMISPFVFGYFIWFNFLFVVLVGNGMGAADGHIGIMMDVLSAFLLNESNSAE